MALAVSVETIEGGCGCEIWLSPAQPVGGQLVTVYCIGALKLDEPLLARLANAIHACHRARPGGAILWHIGADTPTGGLLGVSGGAPGIAAFLRQAGDYGLWWPETWRNASRQLVARGEPLAGLSVFFIQDRADRAPRGWSEPARYDYGSLEEEIARLQRLSRLDGASRKAELTAVGEGAHPFAAGMRRLTMPQLLAELEQPDRAAPMADEHTKIEIDGLGDLSYAVASLHPDWWPPVDLVRPQWRHTLSPRDKIVVSERCLIAILEWDGAAEIRARITMS